MLYIDLLRKYYFKIDKDFFVQAYISNRRYAMLNLLEEYQTSQDISCLFKFSFLLAFKKKT